MPLDKFMNPARHRNSSPNPFSYKDKGNYAGWSSTSIFKRGGNEGVSLLKTMDYLIIQNFFAYKTT